MIREPNKPCVEDLAFTRSRKQLELFAIVTIALLTGCFVLILSLIF